MNQNLARFINFFFPHLTDDAPLWRKVAKELPIIIAIAFLTVLGETIGLFRALETPALDALIRVNPLTIQHTLVVDITDSDYKRFFNERSPLDADKLSEILNAVSEAETSLIVVDIITADKTFKTLRSHNFHGRKILWAQDANPILEQTSQSDDAAKDSDVLKVEAVLGDPQTDPPETGIAVLWPDSDGVVRRYPRMVKTYSRDAFEGRNFAYKPTLPWRAIMDACEVPPSEEKEDIMFDFCSAPTHYPGEQASDIVDSLAKKKNQWLDIAKGQIVIVGGNFGASRDKYATPLGMVDGDKLIALAIESYKQKGPIKPPPEWVMFLSDICCGIIFTAFALMLSTPYLVALALVAPLLGMIFSFYTFHAWSMWFTFIPVIVGIYLHLIYDHLREHAKLLRELNEMKARTRHEKSSDDAPDDFLPDQSESDGEATEEANS